MKEVCYTIPAKMHAELKIRLLYDEISITKFIRKFIEGYIKNDEDILNFVEKYKQEYKIQNKIKRAKNIKLIKKGEELSRQFNLEKEEIEDIYDVLEEKGYTEL